MKIAALLLLLAPALFLFQGEEGSGPDRPAVGEPAPAFRLNDQNGHLVRVGGKSESWTVVAFFPKALTPG